MLFDLKVIPSVCRSLSIRLPRPFFQEPVGFRVEISIKHANLLIEAKKKLLLEMVFIHSVLHTNCRKAKISKGSSRNYSLQGTNIASKSTVSKVIVYGPLIRTSLMLILIQ